MTGTSSTNLANMRRAHATRGGCAVPVMHLVTDSYLGVAPSRVVFDGRPIVPGKDRRTPANGWHGAVTLHGPDTGPRRSTITLRRRSRASRVAPRESFDPIARRLATETCGGRAGQCWRNQGSGRRSTLASPVLCCTAQRVQAHFRGQAFSRTPRVAGARRPARRMNVPGRRRTGRD